MPKIFISYRRADAPGHAGRLRDHLSREFGENATFMDVDDITPGVDFERHLRFILEHVDLFVVVIGPNWNAKNRDGSDRLDDPIDTVRCELESALRQKAFIVPVLVWGARMPRSEELPDSVRGLAACNAFECRDAQWTSDAKRLSAFLKTYGGTSRPDLVPLTMPLQTLRRRLQDAPRSVRRELIWEYLEDKFAFIVGLPFLCGLMITMAFNGVLGVMLDIAPYNDDDPARWARLLLAGYAAGLFLVSCWALWTRFSRRRAIQSQGEGSDALARHPDDR